MEKPTKEQLEKLYLIEKISPEMIGKFFSRSGRQVRNWLIEYGIPRLGPSHLRFGKSATWNIGITRSEKLRKKYSKSHKGKVPHNFGTGRVNFKCIICGNEVFDKTYRKKLTCSAKCKDALATKLSGENHWNFKGIDAGFRQRERNWSAYREWRMSVIKNAKFTCEKCGKTGVKLTAHHKATWNNNPYLRF